jgi:hypothetical protein
MDASSPSDTVNGAGLECLRSRDRASARAGTARRAFEGAKLCLVAIDHLIQVKGDCACRLAPKKGKIS